MLVRTTHLLLPCAVLPIRAAHGAPLLAAFLLRPARAILPAAFGARFHLQLPPSRWSLRWWGTFLTDASRRNAPVTGLTLAAATSMTAVVVGPTAALGLARLRGRMRGLRGMVGDGAGRGGAR